MKIYRLETICSDAKTHSIACGIAQESGGYVSLQGEGSARKYSVFKRGEYLRDLEMNDKYVKRMLPAWAKPDFGPKNIGAKVAAFYAENDKVITRLHHSGFIVGSDEFSDWLETQPDPFRNTRLYRQSLGELRA